MTIGNRRVQIVRIGAYFTSVYGGEQRGRWSVYPSVFVVRAVWGW